MARRGSQRGVLSALERLVDHGLVVREEAGSSFQYTLNRDHLAVVRADGLDPEDPRWRVQIADLAEQVRLWTGNHAGIAEVGASDLPHLAQRQPVLMENLRADAVTLLGPTVSELVEGDDAS